MIKTDEFKQLLIDSLNLEDTTIDDINDDDVLFGDDGLGLDSVDSIELVLAIDQAYGVKITDNKNYDTIFASISNLLKYVNDQKA